MRFALIAACLLVCASVAGCAGSSGCAVTDGSCVRVLFLGNSYTSTNDLPGMFASLAAAAGRRVDVAMVANGGETLADHAASTDDAAELSAGKWDYVMLQEQSEIPAMPGGRPQMQAAVRSLVARIRTTGAVPILFETWAHRDGLPSAGLRDFAAMQAALAEGYRQAGSQSGIGVVPVGDAWATATERDSSLEFWQPDGSHPTAVGTWFSATVMVHALLNADPSQLVTTSGAPSANIATELASVASQSSVK